MNEVRKVSRGCNEAAAKLVADHPGRFGSFATIPLADTEGALRETEYALDTLKADGISLFSNYGDVWLGHATFAPVYEELNRRKAVVYVHPVLANCCANLSVAKDGVPNEIAMIEFGTDTTRALAGLIFSGMTTKFPDITWIFAHGGGTMPFLIERFFQGGASAEIVPGIRDQGAGRAAGKEFARGRGHSPRVEKMLLRHGANLEPGRPRRASQGHTCFSDPLRHRLLVSNSGGKRSGLDHEQSIQRGRTARDQPHQRGKNSAALPQAIKAVDSEVVVGQPLLAVRCCPTEIVRGQSGVAVLKNSVNLDTARR